MSDIGSEAVSTSKALKTLSWLVLLVGGFLGAAILWGGFAAVEPWAWHGVTIEEEWVSIGLGFLGAAVVAVVFGAVWGLLRLGAIASRHLARKNGY